MSATRKEGVTQFVSVKSHAGEPCFLKLDFEPARIEGVDKSAVKSLSEGRFEILLKQGEKAILYPKNIKSATISPINGLSTEYNTFGLN